MIDWRGNERNSCMECSIQTFSTVGGYFIFKKYIVSLGFMAAFTSGFDSEKHLQGVCTFYLPGEVRDLVSYIVTRVCKVFGVYFPCS